MIPESRATALFKQKSGYCSEKPVVAWDDEGYPMVVHEKYGCLVRANVYANFQTVHRADPPEIVGLIPADGWMVTFKDDDDGSEWSTPLIGWGLKADGEVVPLEVDGDGLVSAVEYTGNSRVWHKDHPLDGEAAA